MGASEGRCARPAAQPGAGGPCDPLRRPRQLPASTGCPSLPGHFRTRPLAYVLLWVPRHPCGGTFYWRELPVELPAPVWGPGATVDALPAPPRGCDGCEPSRGAEGAGATCPLGLRTGL